MSRRLTTIAIVMAAMTAAPAAAATHPSGPTTAQIRAAVARAERSNDLWATVNVCNTKRHRDVIGIRAQQPALGFSSTMLVRIGVEYWTGKAFRRDPASGATKALRIGTDSTGVHQTGWSFQFGRHAGRLRGLVEFQWVRSGKVLGSVTRITTSGRTHVGFADPAGYSASECTIK